MNDADSRKMQEVLNWYRQTKGKAPQPRQVQYPRLVSGRALTYEPLLFQVPNGGIPRASWTNITNSKATCKVLEIVNSAPGVYGIGETGDTIDVYNINQWGTYYGRRMHPNDPYGGYQRVGIAHKLISGYGNTDPTNFIWVCEETRHAEIFAAIYGAPVVNPSSISFQHIPFSVVQCNNTFLRFDGSQVNGNYQDAACRIVVEWKMYFNINFTTAADCGIQMGAGFYFNQASADPHPGLYSKPISTNSGLAQSYMVSSRFIKEVTTSTILRPGVGFWFNTPAYGTMTVQLQQAKFNAYIMPESTSSWTGTELTGGVYTTTGSGTGGLGYFVTDDATVAATASVVA